MDRKHLFIILFSLQHTFFTQAKTNKAPPQDRAWTGDMEVVQNATMM